MGRVLAEATRAQKDDSVKAVHDLRTALRRCRSLADGLMELDCHPGWLSVKKTGGRLFGSLAALRDIHVKLDWLAKLAPADDAVRVALQEKLARDGREAAGDAQRSLRRFDRKQWKKWMRALPARARRIPADGLVFQHLALMRHQEALALHKTAVRRRSRAAWHELRLGVKRFRYCVENFLPGHHERWGADLKHLQDLLGDVHDLDVLSDLLPEAGAVYTAEARSAWRERIAAERATRLAEYKSRTLGKESLWLEWRAGLPQGRQLETAAIAWFRAWAGFRDEDWQQRRRLVTLALQLFEGLAEADANVVFREPRNRRILYGAALTQNVGRAKGAKGHHKHSYRMIHDMQPPVGWTSRDMLWTALVARYHRGAEPREDHDGFGSLAPADRTAILWLAATLRLADGLVATRPHPVTAISVESSGAIHIWAHGLADDPAAAEILDEKKHLLETASHRPVMIHAAPTKKAAAQIAS